MGTRGKAGRLSAQCPVCGKLIAADTLPELTKLAGKHCRAPRKTTITVDQVVVSCMLLPTTPWSIAVDRSILSQNKTTYSHWTVYSRDKHMWLDYLRGRTRELQGLRLSWSRWRFERHYKYPAKEMDYANVVGGFKPVPDCLIELGIIVDDKPSMFEASYDQVRDNANFTTITLQECIGSV